MKVNKKWDSKQADELFLAIVSLKNTKEAKCFFRDLCTREELIDMSDRWQTVKQLAKGYDYRTIARNLKVSTTTVARVASWLNNGLDGYKLMLVRLKLVKDASFFNSTNSMHRPLLTNGER